MSLIIFCTKKDTSIDSLLATSPSIEKIVMYYEDLAIHNGFILNKGEVISIGLRDRIILRWPWIIEKSRTFDYSIFIQIMVDKYSSQILLDQKCLSRYSPFYEDKLFQSFVFNDVGVSTPQSWFFSGLSEFDTNGIEFPVVVKKRISSRSKHNVRVDSYKELEKCMADKDIFEYVFQEYIEVETDVRVLALGGKILGAVQRKTHVRDGKRLTVKGMEPYDISNHSIANDITKITTYMGAGLVGFDVLFDSSGKYYFIEANMSPLVAKFADVTGIDVWGHVLRMIENS